MESDKAMGSSDETDSESLASGSDGEDSSDLDEEECERRKSLCLHEMMDLEKQFVALKDQLYMERLNQVERKLEEVRAGKATEYLQPLEELQENMRIRTEVAGILRDMKLNNVSCQNEAECLASKQNLESESLLLKDQIRQDLEEKLRRLEEDRNSIDSEIWSEASAQKAKKKSRFVNALEAGPGRDQLSLPDRRKKPVSVSGPYVVYMLRDSEILEDYNLIKRASKASGTLCYF
jgi:breast cancer metastasis-suppressor 1-like protein